MAHNYFLFTKESYKSFILPPEIVTHWNLPVVDEDGNNISYTVERAFLAADTGAANPCSVKFNADGKAIDVSDEEATHYLCPLNNIKVEVDDMFRALVEGAGAQYKDVKLTAKQARLLRL